MAARNLEEYLREAGDVVELLRNQQTGPNVYPGVPAEYTNWRDEVRAWQQTCVLFNQSYHMVDLAVEGPDAFAMLNHLGVNSFAGFLSPELGTHLFPWILLPCLVAELSLAFWLLVKGVDTRQLA